MSTSVLNNNNNNNNNNNIEPSPSPNMDTSVSDGATSTSSAANNNSSSNNSTPSNQQSLIVSTSMVGAPTSVVVSVSHSSNNNSNINNSTNNNSNQTSAIPSTSAGSSTSQYSQETAATEGTSSSSSSSNSAFDLLQTLNMVQNVVAHSPLIQMSSSSPGTSSVSLGEIISEVQQPNNLMKRTYEIFRDSISSKIYHDQCKRSKTMAVTVPAITSKTLEDGLTLRQKLEQRLNGILCCAVCLDLPKSAIYQCSNGHLMCAGCFTHVLADARLRDESPTCPSCRVSISKESCSRNLAVEKAVCELPGECRFCQRELPRSMLDKHMNEICDERIVSCVFANIGCPWNGPYHEAMYHTENCSHPSKSAREVIEFLEEQERKKREQRKVHETLFTLLSYEKIAFHDVQFRPYRTDEYIHKLFYETSRFSAFNLQWVVKARVNDDQRDPTQKCERHLSFQLCLKSKINNNLTINYMLLKGPYGETKVLPMIYKFDFTETQTESTYNFINLATMTDSNRLLAARMINFRLIMFQASK